MRKSMCWTQRYFNPRSREGSDAFNFAACASLRNFNPRSREGSDVWFEV